MSQSITAPRTEEARKRTTGISPSWLSIIVLLRGVQTGMDGLAVPVTIPGLGWRGSSRR